MRVSKFSFLELVAGFFIGVRVGIISALIWGAYESVVFIGDHGLKHLIDVIWNG